MEADTDPPDADPRRWIPAVYEELRRIARRERWRMSTPDTIGTTALVNEGYLRLAELTGLKDRAQVMRIWAVSIRHILVDRVRAQLAAKRGGDAEKLPLEAAEGFVVEDDRAVLAVHDGLAALEELSPRLAQIVECRFFAGFDEVQTAEALGLSLRTVQRDWATARTWLRRELKG